MATTVKETKIETQVLGYSDSWRGYAVRVAVSGQGPNGKLSGIATVSDRDTDYELRGDGRYSAMHGNSGLYTSDPIYAEIRKLATKAAQEWVAANPNALHEYKVGKAKAEVAKIEGEIAMLRKNMAGAEESLDTAKAELEKLVTPRG